MSKNKNYSEKFKNKVVQDYRRGHLPVSQLLEKHNITRYSLKKWHDAWVRQNSLFLVPHIPKTGGTSLLYHFRNNYGDKFVRSYGPYTRVDCFFKNQLQLEEMSQKERNKLRTVQGHGVSEKIFPYLKDSEIKLMIVLRNPVKHIRSRFNHNHNFLKAHGKELSTDAFLKNTPTNFLTSSIIEKFPSFISPDAETKLEQVTSILSKFDYVFTTENLDSQTSGFFKEYELPEMSERRRVASDKIAFNLTDEEIIEQNHDDIALFNLVNKVVDTPQSHNALGFDKKGKNKIISELANEQIKVIEATTDIYNQLAKSLCSSLRAEAALSKMSFLDEIALKRPLLFKKILQETWAIRAKSLLSNQREISNKKHIDFLKSDRKVHYIRLRSLQQKDKRNK